MLLNEIIILYNGADVCPVSITVSFNENCSLRSYKFIKVDE